MKNPIKLFFKNKIRIYQPILNSRNSTTTIIQIDKALLLYTLATKHSSNNNKLVSSIPSYLAFFTYHYHCDCIAPFIPQNPKPFDSTKP
jgi:hypothetical protein